MIKSVELTDERKKLIQSYYKESVDFDSVFLFAFNAANNDVDSNNERFSLKALKSMSELLIGKCGFTSYDYGGGYSLNKLSRVIEADVRIDAEIPTATGDPYVYVYAVAYIINAENTKDIYKGIIDGELTEVSVSASYTEKYKQGNHTVIDDIIDVYEITLVCPLKKEKRYNAFIDADSFIAEIKNHDYELVSRLGTYDKGMFTIGIQQIVDKLVDDSKKVNLTDLVNKNLSNRIIFERSLHEFLSDPDNIQKVVDLFSDIWQKQIRGVK